VSKLTESHYRKLGNTGFDVSTVGFGTWQIGGGRWRQIDDLEAVHVLQSARDLGVNIYDAAVVYGQYNDESGELRSRSRELLGKAFRCRRDEVYICLKVGQFDEYSHRSDFDARRIVDQLNASLRALGTDWVDICLIHAPSLQDVRDGKAIEVLKTLQALGKVRAIGYSFENEPDHVQAALQQRVDVIMLQYNLIDTDCASVITQARDHGVGILIGGPYKRGYLTGRFNTIEELPMEDDYWKWNLDHNPAKVVRTLAAVDARRKDCVDDVSFRRKALRFILDHPGVASAIVGHRSMAEVKENLELVNE
jgi:aryl-alcohol dehydrogenase-like predicted oxidoreductase